MIRLARALILPLAAAALLAGCAPARPPEAKAPPATATTSPNGEPLPFRAGADDCRGALAAWFNRADTNADGALNLAEMEADADRWFALADQDHDGQVTSDELAAVRRRLVPEPEPDEQAEHAAAGRRTPLPRSQARLDTVMQADANADFRVTAREFRDYVAARFAERERNGALSQSRVLEDCAKTRP